MKTIDEGITQTRRLEEIELTCGIRMERDMTPVLHASGACHVVLRKPGGMHCGGVTFSAGQKSARERYVRAARKHGFEIHECGTASPWPPFSL